MRRLGQQGSLGLGIVLSKGRRLLASEHISSAEAIQIGSLAGEICFHGAYGLTEDTGNVPKLSTHMRFTRFKSGVEITHVVKTPPGLIEEVFAHTRLRMKAPTLLYDIGVGGGTYGKIEANEAMVYGAKTEPFQSCWTVSTLKDNASHADVAGIRPIDAPSQRQWLPWIDRGKSLALVIENAWFSRGMAYEIHHTGDLTVRLFPGLDEYPTTLIFSMRSHFLDEVPHIAAATNPQSIRYPPAVEAIVPE